MLRSTVIISLAFFIAVILNKSLFVRSDEVEDQEQLDDESLTRDIRQIFAKFKPRGQSADIRELGPEVKYQKNRINLVVQFGNTQSSHPLDGTIFEDLTASKNNNNDIILTFGLKSGVFKSDKVAIKQYWFVRSDTISNEYVGTLEYAFESIEMEFKIIIDHGNVRFGILPAVHFDTMPTVLFMDGADEAERSGFNGKLESTLALQGLTTKQLATDWIKQTVYMYLGLQQENLHAELLELMKYF